VGMHTNSIYLKANVMLSYPIDEAQELLSSKLATAKLNYDNCEEDLDFLREQITVRTTWAVCRALRLTINQTMEVAMARVYNWDVVMKRKEKSDQEAIEEKGNDGTPNG